MGSETQPSLSSVRDASTTGTASTAGTASVTGVTPTPVHDGRFLTFAVGPEEYGFEILKVREIIKMLPVTSVPHTPDFVRGIVNLRGQVIPVIDFRRRFHIGGESNPESSCIIIVEANDPAKQRVTVSGVMVDRLCEVVSIPHESIQPVTDAEESGHATGIIGFGKIGSKVKILLSTQSVVSHVPVAA